MSAKRIEAAQELWNGIVEARKGLAAATHGELLKMENWVASTDEAEEEALALMRGDGYPTSADFLRKLAGYTAVRPFVSTAAWAFFAAYSTAIVLLASRVRILQLGGNPNQFLTDVHWAELFKGALPAEEHRLIHSDIDHGLHWALGRLEEHMVTELRRSLSEGPVAEASAIEHQKSVDDLEVVQARVTAGVAKEAGGSALKNDRVLL